MKSFKFLAVLAAVMMLFTGCGGGESYEAPYNPYEKGGYGNPYEKGGGASIQTEKKQKQCVFCSGTGKCTTCGGDGKIQTWRYQSGSTNKVFYDKDCDRCNGNGKCTECYGKGYR